jgi:NTP pyrophosphatase (non-canonical NTP hydrolase)
MSNLNELAKQCHAKAHEKGFWDNPRETGTLLMLIVSELSEALEADRIGNFARIDKYERHISTMNFNKFIDFDADQFKFYIKDSFEDEIADTFIRLLDLVGHLGIDIEKHIELKMKYNDTILNKHGKKY